MASLASSEVVEGYLRSVEGGKRKAGRLEKQAVARYRHDEKTARERGWKLIPELADHVCRFFTGLRHSKGEWAGQPFELSPWEAFIVWNLFGWVSIKDGFRRFRTAYIEVARKNGKTTLAAGIGMYLFAADQEPGCEVYTAATKRDQARLCHGEAMRMRDSSPILTRYIEKWKDNLSIPEKAAKYEPLGADVDGMDGLNVHGAIVDELHAHKSRKCWDLLETGTGSRRQPLIVAITTAGSDKQTICWEMHAQSEAVLEGYENDSYVDDRFFAYIAAPDKDDDWRDPETWEKGNPNLGISVKADNIAAQCKAAELTPGKQNAFRRLRINQWTEQEERWIDMNLWDDQRNKVETKISGEARAFGGLDLASKNDIAAYVLAFEDEDGGVSLKCWFWVPRESMKERVKKDRIPYDLWARQGWIEVTEGNVCDYDFIEKRIIQSADRYQVHEVGYDPWNATQLVTHLMDDGASMVQVSQGYKSFSPACKEWETLVKSGRLRHGNNPVLRWMMSNTALETDTNENQKPSRKKSADKIDGVVAGLMALGRLIATQKGEGSAYDDHGVRRVEFSDEDVAEMKKKRQG